MSMISVAQIAERTGMDKQTVRKWLKVEQVNPIRVEKRSNGADIPFYEESAVEIVEGHKRTHHSAEPNIDPETGLTWLQLKTREEARRIGRENEIAEKSKNQEWMSVSAHHKILSGLVSRLEQIPGKVKSELGQSDKVVLQIQRMLDEAREGAAKEVEEG